MLRADRAHLEARMRQLALTIREKEATLFNYNFQILGKLSAFLVGQGFALLYMKTVYIEKVNAEYGFREYSELPEILFVAFVCISIGLNVLVMAITSWCLVFGADLAIRGEDFESMKRTVDGMYEERKRCIRLFMAGIASLMISGLMLGWTKLHPRSRGVTMAAFGVFFVGTAAYVARVTRPKFRVPAHLKQGGGSSNRPGQYLMGGGAFDPERGMAVHHHHHHGGSAPAAPAASAAVEVHARNPLN